jgi:hypothetical protein
MNSSFLLVSASRCQQPLLRMPIEVGVPFRVRVPTRECILQCVEAKVSIKVRVPVELRVPVQEIVSVAVKGPLQLYLDRDSQVSVYQFGKQRIFYCICGPKTNA